MKALRFVLVAVLLSAVTMGFAHNERKVAREAMLLKTAMQNPDLCKVLMVQVNYADILAAEKGDRIAVTVFYRNRAIVIIGTYAEWVYFFKGRVMPGPSEKLLTDPAEVR